MSAESNFFLSRGHVPNADCFVGASRSQDLAIAAHRHGGHGRGMPGKLAFDLIVGQVPASQNLVVAAGENALAIRAWRHGEDTSRMAPRPPRPTPPPPHLCPA